MALRIAGSLFVAALCGVALALIAALGTSTDSTEFFGARLGATEKGTWGAWLAAAVALAAALMFLLTLVTMSAERPGRRESASSW